MRIIFLSIFALCLAMSANANDIDINVSNIPANTKSIYIPLKSSNTISCYSNFNNSLQDIYCKVKGEGVFVSTYKKSLDNKISLQISTNGTVALNTDEPIYNDYPEKISNASINIKKYISKGNISNLILTVNMPDNVHTAYIPMGISSEKMGLSAVSGANDSRSIGFRIENNTYEIHPIAAEMLPAQFELPIDFQKDIISEISLGAILRNPAHILNGIHIQVVDFTIRKKHL